MAIFNEFGHLDDLGPPKQEHPNHHLLRLDTSNSKPETPPHGRYCEKKDNINSRPTTREERQRPQRGPFDFAQSLS